MTSQSEILVTHKKFPRRKLVLVLLLGCLATWIFNGFLAFEVFVLLLGLIFIVESIWDFCHSERAQSVGKRIWRAVLLPVQLLVCFLLFAIIYLTLVFSGFVFLNINEGNLHDRARQLGQAVHQYHKKHGRFPEPAILSTDGKPLLSWRVTLLPYLGHEQLFNKFRLDEPWDSPHNFPLINKIPVIYTMPGHTRQPPRGETYLQLFVGPGAVFEYGVARTLAELEKGDGPENILIGGIAQSSVPWTKPQDMAFSPTLPVPELGSILVERPFPIFRFLSREDPTRFQATSGIMWADGSSSKWNRPRGTESLRPHITWNGGEKVDRP